MDLSDARDAFISEAQEHLDSAEKAILSMESGKGMPDAESVKQLFRSLHTVKGGAGFLGIKKIKELSHSMENVVGKIREGELAPEREVIEILLKGIDKLYILMKNLEDDNADISAEVQECESCLNREEGKSKTGSEVRKREVPAFKIADLDLAGIRESGLHLYTITLDLAEECHVKKRSLAELAKRLKQVGKILSSSPLLEEINLDAKAKGPFLCSILLASTFDDPDLLSGGLELPAESVNIYNEPEPEALSKKVTGDTEQEVAKEAVPGQESASSINGSDWPSIPLTENTVSNQETGISESKPGKKTEKKISGQQGNQSVRISVTLLDKLMNLVSELVLVRNQNMLASASRDVEKLTAINQKLNTITSELQAAVMQTRLCPVGRVLSNFTRIVRELSRSLGKEVDLKITGSEVELDKGIIEAIGEPLTHLVRNAIDHGIEPPATRAQHGKKNQGTLHLGACHQEGQVHLQIKDDGKGIDPQMLRRKAVQQNLLSEDQAAQLNDKDACDLVFEAGLSTAESVTHISGRGVGMDVVKSRIQKLGGSIEIYSVPGKGTSITVRLPLTLAIMPALIVAVEENRYAIPQINIHEVVWLHGAETYQSIDRVDDKEILWLRNKPVPLLRLSEILHIKKTYKDPLTGDRLPDLRSQCADRRQKTIQTETDARNGKKERRISEANEVYIVIVRVGSDRMGIVADRVVDTEELVVKPFHERLKDCPVLTGTAVLGDSRIAMILDIENIARLGSIEFKNPERDATQNTSADAEKSPIILFDIGGVERFAIPLYIISRVQEIHTKEIQIAGEREYINFRGDLIPLVRIEHAVPNFKSDYRQDCVFIIIPKCKKPIGLLAANILNTVELEYRPDSGNFNQQGILGTQFIEDKLTIFLDIFELISRIEPGWLSEETDNSNLRFLLVEDTSFYQNILSSYLANAGVSTTLAGNGREALQLMEKSDFHAVISDIDMPVMDGFELIRNIRNHQRFKKLPVLAISANENEHIRDQALDNGFNDFQSKLVPEELLGAFTEFIKRVKSGALT